MKSAILCSILLSSAYGWTTPRRSLQQRSLVSVSTILKAKTETTNDPCWQELSDDDCAMENVYASYFVASDWIKSMPCASGLEDCDMPEDLTLPGTRQESGFDEVDVLGFLNLKRAESLGKKSDKDEGNVAP